MSDQVLRKFLVCFSFTGEHEDKGQEVTVPARNEQEASKAVVAMADHLDGTRTGMAILSIEEEL